VPSGTMNFPGPLTSQPASSEAIWNHAHLDRTINFFDNKNRTIFTGKGAGECTVGWEDFRDVWGLW